MTHTKGPWVALDNGWVEAADGDAVCMINGIGLSESPFPEDTPNAHLIAAAPELLEALRGITDRADFASQYQDDKFNFGWIVTHARTAIAKAEGKA